MPRRHAKTSPGEDFIDLVALLPWWAGVLLAAVAYFGLHAVASGSVPQATTPRDVSQMVATSLWRGLASGGQYLVPALCLIGALVSAVRRHKRRKLADSVAGSRSADALEGITWQDFERLVGEGFRREGYAVAEQGGGGADGGIDLVLRKGGEKFLVQCKQWKAYKVSVNVVRELYGVMAVSGAAGGFVVTSGTFTKDAQDFAQGRNIQLVDGIALMRLLRREPTLNAAQSAPVQRPTPSQRPEPTPVMKVEVAPQALACPVCTKSMVKRIAKRGQSAGSVFWGCSGYPNCKGTRPMAQA